jgi:glycosyltransferase involved in cell wall biosynthesis
MKKIILFYKRLIKPGGAEKLLIKEYGFFKKNGYQVKIITYEFNRKMVFFDDIDSKDVIEIKTSDPLIQIIKLSLFLRRNSDCIFICNSGYVDFYLASIFSRVEYYLHIHQPSFMSFNEKDKYSIFMKNAFKKLVNANYGAKRFIEIKQSLNFLNKIVINLRAFFSINAVRKAKSVFVLSDYAVREKKTMYGIEAINISGALDQNIFKYNPRKIINFDSYKNKILTIARLDKNKRLDSLILAFSGFLIKHPSSILIIGGMGPEYENLEELIDRLKIGGNVKLLGFIPEEQIYDYYAWADLFVSIDWADFRITSFEAMAIGTRVLLSDETDSISGLQDTGYYYLTRPDVYSVEQEIENALLKKNTVDKDKMINILKQFTWDEYFSKMELIVND